MRRRTVRWKPAANARCDGRLFGNRTMQTKSIGPFDVHCEPIDDDTDDLLVRQIGRSMCYADATNTPVCLDFPGGASVVINPGDEFWSVYRSYLAVRIFVHNEVHGGTVCKTKTGCWYYRAGKVSRFLSATILKFASLKFAAIRFAWRFALHERLP